MTAPGQHAQTCQPWGQCAICDAARSAEPGWRAVMTHEYPDGQGGRRREVTEVRRLFWVRRSSGRTRRLRGWAQRTRLLPAAAPTLPGSAR